jgi:integrase
MTKILHRDPDRRCKTIEEWPAPDRDLWRAALCPGDLLEEGGSRAAYAKISNEKIVKGYGRWLTWLDRRGLLQPSAAPADRISPARVRDYIADLERDNASQTLLARLQELGGAAAVMDPDRDWSWINRIASHIRARNKPARPKRPRVIGAGTLVDFGLALMAAADNESTPRRRATTYRDGLIIALLAMRPLRLRNLAGLVLGETVVFRGAEWWIEIPADETKTHEPIEMPWPEALLSQLQHYLAIHRPFLAGMRGRWSGPIGEALWLSSDGSQMTKIAIYDRVVARTRQGLGRAINPHLFRDCVATTLAIEDPEHVRIASRLLGHRTPSSAERFYNQAGSIEASRKMQAVLLSLRQSTNKTDGSGRRAR